MLPKFSRACYCPFFNAKLVAGSYLFLNCWFQWPCVAARAVMLTEGMKHPPGIQLQKQGFQVGAWGWNWIFGKCWVSQSLSWHLTQDRTITNEFLLTLELSIPPSLAALDIPAVFLLPGFSLWAQPQKKPFWRILFTVRLGGRGLLGQ